MEMIVNSNELCVTLIEVIPSQLQTVVCGGQCTCGATLKQIQDMVTRRYVLSVDNDTEFRSRSERREVVPLQLETVVLSYEQGDSETDSGYGY